MKLFHSESTHFLKKVSREFHFKAFSRFYFKGGFYLFVGPPEFQAKFLKKLYRKRIITNHWSRRTPNAQLFFSGLNCFFFHFYITHFFTQNFSFFRLIFYTKFWNLEAKNSCKKVDPYILGVFDKRVIFITLFLLVSKNIIQILFIFKCITFITFFTTRRLGGHRCLIHGCPKEKMQKMIRYYTFLYVSSIPRCRKQDGRKYTCGWEKNSHYWIGRFRPEKHFFWWHRREYLTNIWIIHERAIFILSVFLNLKI